MDIRQRLDIFTNRLADIRGEDLNPENIKTLAEDAFKEYWCIPVLEAALSLAREAEDHILRDDIPSLLAEYGMKSCQTLDGKDVGLETVYSTSQKDKDKNLLIAWLNENGYGDIVKDTLALGRGEFDEKLSTFLARNGYSYDRDSGVNGQTLKKTIKDHLDAGGERPPESALGIKVYTQAFVKAPKEQKKF